jgi:hypothetical protein
VIRATTAARPRLRPPLLSLVAARTSTAAGEDGRR